MKKLMTALLCAVGFSLVSQAERINGTNFEALPVGTNVVGYADESLTTGGYWTGEGVDALIATNTVTLVNVPSQEPGAEPIPTEFPDIAPYTGTVGYPSIHGDSVSEKYLAINTKGGELVRTNNNDNAQSIGEGIYFDSMVQFTATDALDANATSQSDKLVLWLCDNGDGTTNLVVNAGYLDKWGEPQSTNYVVTSNVQADKWYRLTIQAIEGVINNGDNNYVGYAIYIDGIKAEYSNAAKAFCTDEDVDAPYNVEPSYSYLYNSEVHALFPSLLGYTDKAKTFTSVAFSGVGAVDDIEFTTEAPEFIGPDKVYVAQIGTQGYETLAEAVAAAVNGQTVVLLADVNEAIVNTVDKTFTIDLNGQTWSSDSDVLTTTAGTITINATNGGTMTTEAAQCCAVWAKGGSVVINGGTFNSKDNEEATIYVSNANSVITINGGTFQNTDARPYRWKNSLAALTLNVMNDLVGQHLIINGGTFYGNDPQLGDDTAGGTSAQSSVAFVSSGFVAIQDGSGNWVVQAGYNVTFDVNGGSPAPAAQRVAAGGTATEPTEPTKEDYTFTGWFASGAETAFDFDTVLSADLVLTAAWEQSAPAAPVVDGQTVVAGEEFNTATTEKPITYPSTPTITGEVGNQTITYGTSGSVSVPEYYTATVGEGNTVNLTLNDNALATIGDATVAEEAKQAIEIGGDTVGVTLTTTNPKLYYGVQTCSTPDGTFTLQSDSLRRGNNDGSAMQLSVTRGENESAKFYRLYVTDVAPAQN